MPDEEFERKKKTLFQKLKSEEELDKSLKAEIIEVYGSRGEKAIEVLEENRIHNEEGRWFVEGSEEEYEIVGTHCSCYDFVLNIATEKASVDMCYHALAKTIRELLDSEK